MLRVSPRSGRTQRATVPDVPDVPDAVPTDDRERIRHLEGLAIGAGTAYSSACAGPRSATDCRLVRTRFVWRTTAR